MAWNVDLVAECEPMMNIMCLLSANALIMCRLTINEK